MNTSVLAEFVRLVELDAKKDSFIIVLDDEDILLFDQYVQTNETDGAWFVAGVSNFIEFQASNFLDPGFRAWINGLLICLAGGDDPDDDIMEPWMETVVALLSRKHNIPCTYTAAYEPWGHDADMDVHTLWTDIACRVMWD